jgi:ABC-2 type transport system ATP-binding protein
MSDPVIKVEDLTRRFGDFIAVDHLNFLVEPGEVVGYLGPNGSGKTTTIRMLLGLLEPSEGKALVLGFDAFRQSEEVRKRVGYMSQKFALYDDLTVLENMTFYGGVYGIGDKERIKATLDLVGLTDHGSTLSGSLSAGWRQRLALGIALVHNPRLLFLDEPTSGVDPTARRAFWDLIYGMADEGVTVLVTTHYMDEAEYCARVGIMREGKLLAMDTPLKLKKQFVPGVIREIFCEPLEQALVVLSELDGILRVGIAGDYLRVISEPVLESGQISKLLKTKGVNIINLVQGEPTLEDVFISLAR